MPRIYWILLTTLLLASSCKQTGDAPRAMIPHPDNHRSTIEFFVETPNGRGPWPTVLYLHGHQNPTARNGGRAFADWGVLRRSAGKGYLAVAVSLPGYGNSSGPEDFAGPYSQNAVRAVLANLVADRKADPDRILIQGVSLGAVTAALVAARDKQIAGLVLISGLYDLPAFFVQPKSAGALLVKAAADRQTGGSAQALRSRSALFAAAKIRAATLIMNGAKDDRTDVDQARRFAAAINAHGGRAKVHVFADLGHEIPVKIRDAEISGFIDETLRR